MATFAVALGTQYQLNLDVNQASQNIAANQSTVGWALTIHKLSGTGRWTTSADSWGASIHGSGYGGSFTYDFRSYSSLLIGAGSTVINHNPDGTATIGASGTFNDVQANIGAGTASGSLALTNIPRGPFYADAGTYKRTLAYYADAGIYKQVLVYYADAGIYKMVGG